MVTALAPTATIRAAVYARVSTPGQNEDGYGLDGQVAECLALAERIGAAVWPELIYREVGSGADWDLPLLLDLLDRAQRREIDVVITLATSRLARDVGKLAVLQRTLKRSDVTIQYVHHQFDDTPTGQLTETMLAAIDVYERQNSALRFALGKRAKLARKLVMGLGPTPYGYRAVKNEKGSTVALEIDPETAPTSAGASASATGEPRSGSWRRRWISRRSSCSAPRTGAPPRQPSDAPARNWRHSSRRCTNRRPTWRLSRSPASAATTSRPSSSSRPRSEPAWTP